VQHFISGVIVVLLIVVPLLVLLLRKKIQQIKTDKKYHPEQLEELAKLTGELAHEIKNPLSTIKINLKLISEELQVPDVTESGKMSLDKDEQKLARARRKIAIIQKETDRLEEILDGFLRYVNRAELQLANVNINELVSDMIDFYSPQAYSHSITIRQGLYNEPLICKIDARMLKQVILNLFVNAQYAMSNGGELMIRTDKQQTSAVIQISDTGCGIDKDILSNIFKPYYSSRPEGMGLGLATARKIVEGHKGSITVNSEPGKGTSFTIKLPLLTADKVDIGAST
jgi:two-component system sensor histidine kinase HydH